MTTRQLTPYSEITEEQMTDLRQSVRKDEDVKFYFSGGIYNGEACYDVYANGLKIGWVWGKNGKWDGYRCQYGTIIGHQVAAGVKSRQQAAEDIAWAVTF